MLDRALRVPAALALLVSVVGFTDGCAAHAESDGVDQETASITTARGVDYAWGRPAPSTLRSSGYTFAARYLSYDTTGKTLSAAEATTLRHAGVDVVVVWEQGGSDVLRGYNEGVTEAREAERQAIADGMPANRPIYFAIDFDEQASQDGSTDAYFDGVASVIGRARTGAYAGYYAIKRLFDAGKIAWGWQTYAWSSGHWDARAQLRQVHNGVTVGGVDCDLDNAVANDFGQWGATGGGQPPPPPPPPPPPTTTSCHSSTLDKDVPSGTCVQSSGDSAWYHCDNGTWVAGESGCTSTYAFCHSATLGTDVPVRTCVQARSDSVWYQCTQAGWEQPVSNGAGPSGTCSSMHGL